MSNGFICLPKVLFHHSDLLVQLCRDRRRLKYQMRCRSIVLCTQSHDLSLMWTDVFQMNNSETCMIPGFPSRPDPVCNFSDNLIQLSRAEVNRWYENVLGTSTISNYFSPFVYGSENTVFLEKIDHISRCMDFDHAGLISVFITKVRCNF